MKKSIIITMFWASNHEHSIKEEDQVITQYYVPCPEGGKHTMTEQSMGEIRENGKMDDPDYVGYNSSLNTSVWDSYIWY